MDNKSVRKLAVKLLDDENGIGEEAVELLSNLLVETDNEDLLPMIESTDGRFYMGEDDAEEELHKIQMGE